YRQWIKRNPIYAKTQLGAYNWRMLQNPEPTLRNAMKEIILNDPTDEIFEIVDYSQIARILENQVDPSLNRLVWGLASIKIYRDYLSSKINRVGQRLYLNIPGTALRTLD